MARRLIFFFFLHVVLASSSVKLPTSKTTSRKTHTRTHARKPTQLKRSKSDRCSKMPGIISNVSVFRFIFCLTFPALRIRAQKLAGPSVVRSVGPNSPGVAVQASTALDGVSLPKCIHECKMSRRTIYFAPPIIRSWNPDFSEKNVFFRAFCFLVPSFFFRVHALGGVWLVHDFALVCSRSVRRSDTASA